MIGVKEIGKLPLSESRIGRPSSTLIIFTVYTGLSGTFWRKKNPFDPQRQVVGPILEGNFIRNSDTIQNICEAIVD